MLNKLLRITLAAIVLTCFVSFVYASDSESTDHGPHDLLDRGKRREYNAKEEAEKQFDRLMQINMLVIPLSIAYDAAAAQIERGETVSIATAVGLIASVVLTKKVPIPSVGSITGQARVLGMSWQGRDNILYRYNEALQLKVYQVPRTKTAITAYNKVYWNEYYRVWSNHLTAVTTHNSSHHKPVRTQWSRTPNYSLPSFRCKGSCRQSFPTPLGDHGEVCGLGSEVPGCHDVWYSCVDADVREHSPIRCTLDYKIYRKLPNTNKELIATKTCPDSFRRCMSFDLGYHEEVHHGYLNAHGNFQYERYYGKNKIRYGQHKKHNHDPNVTIRPYQTLNLSVPPPTSSYHPCGVHETSESGDHSWITPACGDITHAGYACQIGSTHTNLQASCSVTNSNGDYCTYASFYACQSHTHVYPAPTPSATCARKACGQTVSHRLAHRIDCDNCDNHYWTCIEGATHNHTTTFTCRRSGCGVTFTKCSNGVCPESSAGNYHWAAD